MKRLGWFAFLATGACVGTVEREAATTAEGPGEVSADGVSKAGGGGGAARSSDPANSVSPAAKPPENPSSMASSCKLGQVAAPLRRLTRFEYNNTVRDLLGTTARPADEFEGDLAVAGFDSNSAAPLTRAGTEDYMKTATQLATQANLMALLPCDPRTGDDGCARKFITDFGLRAFRRPLTTPEAAVLYGVYVDKKRRSNLDGGVRLVMEILLQAPSFLYRPDLSPTDAPPVTNAASAYELASRLSYFLWRTMPDSALLTAAETGSIFAADKLESQVRRMMAEPRAQSAIRSFYDQWLQNPRLDNADKDLKLFPQFTAALKTSMREETALFVDSIYKESNGSLATLLTAPYSFVDARLAKIYGVSGPAQGFAKTSMPAGQRSGVLTMAAGLSVNAFASEPSPIHRGLFVRHQFLCQELEPPPAANITAPKIDPSIPLKDRLAQHRSDPSCNACHRLMEPLGIGFQHYDAIGRWQVMDGKFPVDAQGEVIGSPDADGVFDGAQALGERLAKSKGIDECMARQWYRFAMGRMETAEESCLMSDMARRLSGTGRDLRELLVAIATSKTFINSRTTN